MSKHVSSVSINMGNDRVKRQKLQDLVELQVMDATSLKYDSNMFDLVIGHSVIHHGLNFQIFLKNSTV